MRDFVGDDAGFAGACACEDEDWAADGLGGLALGRVEVFEAHCGVGEEGEEAGEAGLGDVARGVGQVNRRRVWSGFGLLAAGCWGRAGGWWTRTRLLEKSESS